MSSLAPRSARFRSSTSASNAPATTKATEVLKGLFDLLAATVDDRSINGYPDSRGLLRECRQIHQYVAAMQPPSPVQDDFRHLSGYQKMLDVLRAFSGFYDPQIRAHSEKKALFELLHAVLAVLSATFRGHTGNRRYFRYRVEGGGWEALEQIIASIGLGGSESDLWTNCQLFGKLLSFSLDDQRLDELCQTVAAAWLTEHEESDGVDKPEKEDQARETTEDQDCAYDIAYIETKVCDIIGPKTILHNAEILRTVVGFWESIPRLKDNQTSSASILVLSMLAAAIAESFHNLSAVHATGVLSRFLHLRFHPDSILSDIEKEKVLGLCQSLMRLGVNKLADAQFLLSCRDAETSRFCLDMTSQYAGPWFIQFDLSIHGHSSIELPTLGRPFPPQSSPGYTFSAWIHVDRYDPNSHTTIFGVFDSSQTCFLLAYLERDTHNFILQTSVTSQRPSVRFKSVVFQPHEWYHIAIIHRRPKTLTPSKASLYVNGELAEQIRVSYPSPPPLSNGSTESFASFASSSNKSNPVQAFLGTPRDLSSQIGPGRIFSKWSLASAHLFEDILSDDFLAVHYRLGPRYQGNFQDCLGGFQTYEASAALGLRNELLHSGKDDKSDILKAIREKASNILPEAKVLMSTILTSVYSTDDKFLDSQLFRSLSRASANNLYQLTAKSGTAIAINAALPSVNDALVRGHGVAVLTGDPILAMPFHFDDNLWRLAGFTPLALKMIERATAGEELLRSVELTFLCISKSWRNSEAMERDNGYALLGMLLRAKLGYGPLGTEAGQWRLNLLPDDRDKLTFQLLSLVLGFVGYKHEDPVASFIVNPLAYRILLIDFDTWRKSAPITQELYYKQFAIFAITSQYHAFNIRRLLRMRIIKRLLDAVKAETISEDVVPHFLASFESLVKCNYTAEVHRSLALFITYAFHTSSSSHPRTPRPFSSASRPSTPAPRRPTIETDDSASGQPSKSLTKKQLGIKILEMYTRLLCEKGNATHIKKFAKTVTNKWLLYLLAEDDPEAVVYGCKILARLLVTHGQSYTSKFSSKTGGFWIMTHRLKHWWDIPTLWPICLSILFGYDVADVDFDRSFDFFSLIEMFGDRKMQYPEVLPVIIAMLQQGLRDMVHHQDDPDSPIPGRSGAWSPVKSLETPRTRPRSRSMALSEELQSRATPKPDRERVMSHASVLQTVIRFFADLYSRSNAFKEFTLSSEYIRLLLSALYPLIVSTDPVQPETELNSKDSALTFEGTDVIIRPISGPPGANPIVRTSSTPAVENLAPSRNQPPRGTALRRPSSFILLTSQIASQVETPARLEHVMSPKKRITTQKISNAVLDEFVELVVNVFTDQLLARKEFVGFGLFMKVPPGFQEHQAYFQSFMLKHTISGLQSAIQLDQKQLHEPKVITNMARFNLHMSEAIFEGWFMNGAEPMLDFTGMLLEYLQRPDVSSLKSVRLCSQALATIRVCFLKLILLRLSDMDDPHVTDAEALKMLQRVLYWQTVLLGCLSSEEEYMKLLWYQLYSKLTHSKESIRQVAAGIWRIMLVQMPQETSDLFRHWATADQIQLTKDFGRLTEVDDNTFVEWVDQHRPALDVLFFGGMSKPWEDFVSLENQHTTETAKSRLAKRKDMLRQWQAEALERDNVLLRHEMANSAWMKSIFLTEHFKHQRLMQDQQDDLTFLMSNFRKMNRDLTRPGAVFAEPSIIKWKLDRTEGRNRMRLRLLPDYTFEQQEYQPKRRGGDLLKLNTEVGNSSSTTGLTPITAVPPVATPMYESPSEGPRNQSESAEPEHGMIMPESGVAPEEDFELVDDPNDPDAEDTFEDKNRKVMRRLERGDIIQNVYNISRIVGLEACEGILIIGKEAMYIMDNVFLRSDKEIVNVWQAPAEERDPYSQIITDPKTRDRKQNPNRSEQESRCWRWHDVISVSKRRFLFRDVAIEIFFTDGRSYLLTAIDPAMRDELYGKLMGKTPHTVGTNSLPNPEDAWRLEALKVFEEVPQTLGSKFGSIFNSSPWNPVMRRWQRGELSNFHYLMLVNTMAGRTFNDLTQYPVFPWVLADYTSEELDLSNPLSYRDLSKPMGAQTGSRQADFMMRYNSLAEIGQTPFHYGTHYSSAMVVCSYLIRLPPFTQSYMLLQGGNFDHPDRLFFSIAGAWNSASRDNGTDVREITPEFFCLPDFLTNINGYAFGTRQGGQPVDNVILPPWAKGDPKIFIAKHREALESQYVTERLHLWIDLIFGHKQRGEAAVENLNVFHNLSYHGAVDLDNILDPKERAIVTGIIHNFGQTPLQVFSRPHPPREHNRGGLKKLDTSPDALAKLPYPVSENHERITSLIYAPKLDRLLCSTPFRINMPPQFDKFLEWGYADNSVRFYFTDNRKPAGLFENLHIGQVSCLTFADSKTLVTAGEDCVVSVYSVQTASGKPVELLPRSSLFGHKTPVTTITVSKPFSTFVTVSQDGIAFLWDLNRLEFVRKLPSARPVECVRINDVSGEIMLCSGSNVLLYTLNGDLILDQNVCGSEGNDDYVYSCSFYEGMGNEWLENYLVFTGHRPGKVNIWRKVVGLNGRWMLELLRRLDHVDPSSETGANVDGAITCIMPMPHVVYTGDDDGRVYEWKLIQRER